MLGIRREELSKLKYEDYDESMQSTKIGGKEKEGAPELPDRECPGGIQRLDHHTG